MTVKTKKLLSVGDRVKLKPDAEDGDDGYIIDSVGEGNIGTITRIVGDEYYVIEWDYPGPHTYREDNNRHQYNVSCTEVVQAGPALTQQERICKKVKYLEDKFKQRKVHYDF